MTDRQTALEDIVALAQRHDLSAADIRSALNSAGSGSVDTRRRWVARTLSYLAGIFVLSGIAVYCATFWPQMNAGARITITLGSGFVAYLLALATLTDERYDKLATPLFLIAALLQPGGILVVLDEYYSSGNWHYAVLVAAGAVLIQQALSLWATGRAVLVFTCLFFGVDFFATIFDLLRVAENWNAVILGCSLLLICYGLQRTRYQPVTPVWYLVGAGGVLAGAFDLIRYTSIEPVFIGLAALLVFVSTVVKSRTLLVIATMALLSYIGYFSNEHFADSIGWPVTLIALGVILALVSGLVIRIDRRFIR